MLLALEVWGSQVQQRRQTFCKLRASSIRELHAVMVSETRSSEVRGDYSGRYSSGNSSRLRPASPTQKESYQVEFSATQRRGLVAKC